MVGFAIDQLGNVPGHGSIWMVPICLLVIDVPHRGAPHRTPLYSPAMDTLTPTQRSERMRKIRGKDTALELRVRRLIHAMGYRYRLHRMDLPGCPDMVFPSRRAVIFVHGCFWHRHEGCKLARLPKSRLDFWVPKLETNRARDVTNERELERQGWRALVVWECEVADTHDLKRKVREFLDCLSINEENQK